MTTSQRLLLLVLALALSVGAEQGLSEVKRLAGPCGPLMGVIDHQLGRGRCDRGGVAGRGLSRGVRRLSGRKQLHGGNRIGAGRTTICLQNRKGMDRGTEEGVTRMQAGRSAICAFAYNSSQWIHVPQDKMGGPAWSRAVTRPME